MTTLSAAAGIVLAVPHLLLVANRAVGQPDPPPVTAANLAEELLRLPVGMLTPPLAAPAAAVMLVLLAVGVFVAWHRGDRRQAVLLATWVALPPLVLCVLQLFGWGPGLVARYWTLCLPAIAIGAAVAIEALWIRSRTAAIATSLLIVVLTVPSHLALRAVDGHLGQGWRDLPRVLAHPTLRGRSPARRGVELPGPAEQRARPARSDGADRRSRSRGQDQSPDARPGLARVRPAGRRRWPGGGAAAPSPASRRRCPGAARSAVSVPSSRRSRSSRCGASTSGTRSACSPRRTPPLTAEEAEELARAHQRRGSRRGSGARLAESAIDARRTQLRLTSSTTGPNRGSSEAAMSDELSRVVDWMDDVLVLAP